MKTVALALVLAVTLAVGDSSHWVEVAGGAWKPSPQVLSQIEAALKADLPTAAVNRGRLPEWHSYTFQYQGRTPLVGRRFVFVNAFCDDSAHHPDLTKTWVAVMDGGACFFSAKYDPDSRRVYDLVINGVA